MHVNPSATLLRQWTLLQLLPAWPQTRTVTALREGLVQARFAPGRMTVLRDLADLSLRFPIACDDSGKTHRWGWAKGAAFDVLPRLSVEQCLALVVAREHLRLLLPGTVLAGLGPLFEAAERELKNSGYRDWPRRIAVAPPAFALLPPTIEARVLADVHDALARRRCLTADYDSLSSGTVTRRAFDPLGLLIRDTAQYLVALVPGEAKPRQFALHRMTGTVVEAGPCRELHGFSMARYARSLTYDSHGPIRLVAIFDAKIARLLQERPIAKYQTWKPIGDTGNVEIRASVEDDQQLKWALLSYGAGVQVLGPARLRGEMMEELERAVGAYRRR